MQKSRKFYYSITIFCLYLFYAFLSPINNLLSKFQRISQLQLDLETATQEKLELKKKRDYLLSDTFLEKELRNKKLYTKEGELMVALKDEVVISDTTNPSELHSVLTIEDSNFLRWFNLIFKPDKSVVIRALDHPY